MRTLNTYNEDDGGDVARVLLPRGQMLLQVQIPLRLVRRGGCPRSVRHGVGVVDCLPACAWVNENECMAAEMCGGQTANIIHFWGALGPLLLL